MTDTATHLVQTSHLSFNLQKCSAFRITFAKAFRSSVFPNVHLLRMTIAFPYVLFTHNTHDNGSHCIWIITCLQPWNTTSTRHTALVEKWTITAHATLVNFSQLCLFLFLRSYILVLRISSNDAPNITYCYTCLHFQNNDNLMLLNSCRTHEITAPLFLLGNFMSLHQKQKQIRHNNRFSGWHYK